MRDPEIAAKLGIGAAALVIVLLAVWFWLHRDDCSDRALVLAAALLAVAIPFFLPHMHDRYFFAADALTLALAAAWPQLAAPAVLCEFASLLGYHAYLKMRYRRRARAHRRARDPGGRAGAGTTAEIAAGRKNEKIDLSRKFVVDIPRFSVIITHAFEKCICGSAGIGRQAGLRCLCPTIDVWVQVPSPAPKIGKHHMMLADFYFFCFFTVHASLFHNTAAGRVFCRPLLCKRDANYPTMKYRTMSAHSRYMIGSPWPCRARA